MPFASEEPAAGESEDDLASWLCGSLSRTERMYGFILCFSLGTFLSIVSTFYVVRFPIALVSSSSAPTPVSLQRASLSSRRSDTPSRTRSDPFSP